MKKKMVTLMAAIILMGGLAVQAHATYHSGDITNISPDITVDELAQVSFSATATPVAGAGDSTTHTWTQIGGIPVDFNVTYAGQPPSEWICGRPELGVSTVTFTAPDIPAGTSEVLTFEFNLHIEAFTCGNFPFFGHYSPIYESALVTVTIADANEVPVADAGSDQSVRPGQAVSLDASASYDPDENYPLTYAWEIVSAPYGSMAELSDTASVNSSFTADMSGDYTLSLVVTDDRGVSSEADEILVSTYNTPPVAAAGEDQAVIIIGTFIQLNGTQSYDEDGDDITYEWTLTAPAGSTAVLSDSTAPAPTFEADVHGDYVAELTVSDAWTSGEADTVTIGFENIVPIADAGDNQSVTQGELVSLDGNSSTDANLDALAYSWSIVSKPEGSLTALSSASAVAPSILADLPGEYVLSLVVNDGFADSEPSNVNILAVSYVTAATDILQQILDTINSFDNDVFKNKNMKKALTNKVNAVIKDVVNAKYAKAVSKLENDIMGKSDGCADADSSDKNDWIISCDAQNQLYPLIIEAISLLNNI